MKTKIIYISGSEIFDMGDIRDAFDQVRSALQLGPDTVLFGVPVDKADALSDNSTQNIIPSVSVTLPDTAPVALDATPEIATPIAEESVEPTAPVATPVAEVTEEVVPQKKTRGRPKSAKKAEPKPVDDVPPETDANVTDTPQAGNSTPEKVVSILSVLTAKQDETNAPEQDTVDVMDADIESVDAQIAVSETTSEPVAEIAPEIDIIDDTPIDTDVTDTIDDLADTTDINDDIDIIDDDATQSVSIDDMITNEAPVTSQEKTLEQLLESMTPLREDLEHEQHIDATDSTDDFDADNTPDVIDTVTDDDATLEQLANEFAENQDKIETSGKAENHGKIGKLKNILPFKKARRDDNGLMGDLFGWAGIAANDEDFAIPGFFTNAASKK